MMYGLKYSTPASVGLFEGKHHEVTSDATMEDQNSQERVLRWIAKQIAIDGENVVWVTTTPTLITKASLSFLAKIIATEMRDMVLNERAALPFPYLIGKLCRGVNIPPNSLIEVQNSESHPSLPQRHHHLQLQPPRFQCQTRTLVDQIVLRMPQLIEMKVLAAKKEIKDEVRKELAVLKDRLDGLENLVQDRFQAPSTQSIDDLWGEPPTSKSSKRKHKAGELDEETPTDPAREARRQEKRARRISKREAQEKEAIEQQQRDAALDGTSGSGAPALTSEDQTDQVPSSESATIDKGANTDPTTGA
ncbi:hypothetical protein KY284_030003 [Solanum tuberosum]|nr:hypothetical protein KY284_030003 [Solanum tuberosum]